MGLREGKIKNMAPFPLQLNAQYLTLCKKFLEIQLDIIKPALIVTLGKVPLQFLNQNIKKIESEVYPILHPSMWNTNIKKSDKSEKEIKAKLNSY